MGRSLAFFIAVLVSLVPPTVSGSASASTAAAPPLANQGRMPLSIETIEDWGPLFVATQDLQAAAEASMGRTVTYYDVQPLGDADRDGAADFLVVSRIHILANRTDDPAQDPDVATLSGTSGANGQALWTRGLSAEESWYMLGDVDGDGVNDLVVVTYKYTPSGTGIDALFVGQGSSQNSYRADYTFVSGRDGGTLFERQATGSIGIEQTYAFLPAGSVSRYNFTLTGEAPSGLAVGVSGVDWIRYRSTTSYVVAFAAVAFVQVLESSYAPTIERLDSTGKAQWRLAPTTAEGTLGISSRSDVTGDRIPDYVITERISRAVYTLGGSVPVSTNSRLAKVTTYDGKTGTAVWSHDVAATDFDPTKTTVSATYGGRAEAAKGSVLLTIMGPTSSQPDQYATTLRLLDGSDGSVLASKTFAGTYLVATSGGDIDADSSDELVAASMPRAVSGPVGVASVLPAAPPGTSDLSVLKRDLSPAWTIKDVPFRTPTSTLRPDVDGDGAQDLTIIRFEDDNVTTELRSLRDATTLWTHTSDRRVENMVFVPSVDGLAGAEVGITELEVPLGSLPQDDPFSFYSDFNYAPYGATLSLRRGEDNQLVWSARVREPSKSGETLLAPFPQLQTAGDINQDGVPDLLYTLRSNTYYRITCSDTCIVRVVGDDELLVNLALVLSGADGALLYAYPDQPGGLSVKQGPIRIAATPKIRANSADGSAPGLDALAVLAPLVAVAIAFRFSRRP